MPETSSEQLDPNLIFEWLEIPEDERASALQFFAEMTLMPEEEVDALTGTSLDDYLIKAGIPEALRAFVVSLCCDGMFMVPVDRLDAAEAIHSLQDIFLRGGGIFSKGGYGRVVEAICEGARRHGAVVHMGERVRRIVVEDGRVQGIETNQGVLRAPLVISNAGLQPTVLKLVGEEHFDVDYVEYVRNLEPSYSLIGYRYFLSRPVTDAAFGVIFSNASPWSQARWEAACQGRGSREGVLYFEVPVNYDPDAAPEGKQMIMTGSFCPPDPDLSKEELQSWADAGERALFGAFPELEGCIESKDFYTTKSVSNATRDSALPGVGGETIGLGQIVGQCGEQKPDVRSPIAGLYFVGADAGGTGIGTQQAIESGMNVAAIVETAYRSDCG